jgi:hypothetical protein
LGLPKRDQDKETRIVFVDIEDRTICSLVDVVNKVLWLPGSITEVLLKITTGLSFEYTTE